MSTDLITDLTVLSVGALLVGADVHLGGLPGVDVQRVAVAEWRFATGRHVVVLRRDERTWSVAERTVIGTSPTLFTAIELALTAA